MNLKTSPLYALKWLQKTVVIFALITVIFGMVPVKVASAEGGLLDFLSGEKNKAEEEVKFPEGQARPPRIVKKFTITFYNSLPNQTDNSPCITANGYDLCEQYETEGFGNTIATNLLPFGAVVKIPSLYGDKEFVVRDRMNQRYNGKARMDIWLPTYAEAKKNGVKRSVEVLVY